MIRQIWDSQEDEKRGIRCKFTWKGTAGVSIRVSKRGEWSWVLLGVGREGRKIKPMKALTDTG